MPNPPVLWDIESDPVLAGTKLIAEAWDAAGLYQVGSFVGDSWQEWNGRFRDDVRRFVKGDRRHGAPSRTRGSLGSPDLYGHEQREAGAEHQLRHLPRRLHAERPRLATTRSTTRRTARTTATAPNDNMSWNCGVEGPTDDPDDRGAAQPPGEEPARARCCCRAGTPMLLMGDEVRRTQRGNNNAYCQDNEISWFDWTLLERHGDIRRFVKALVEFRQRRDVVDESRPITLNELLHRASIEWHGVELGRPDCGDNSHSLALAVGSLQSRFLFHSMMNAYWEPLAFELP